MNIRLKTDSASKVFASDLEVSDWFLDIDGDISLVVNDSGTKRILFFGSEPSIRCDELDKITVRQVLDPNKLEICK